MGFHTALVESERLREEIGRLPVPLGYCTEQHNVRALGAHGPFSHQCLGCEHFRTDPSHLPDLYAYLERLLETRERLRVAVAELAEWARTRAIPADGEIRTVRTLIRAGEGVLDALAPDERARLLELFRVLCSAPPERGWTARSGSSSSRAPAIPSRRSPRRRSRHCSLCRLAKTGPGRYERPRGEHEHGQAPHQQREARARHAVIAQIKDQAATISSKRRSSPAELGFTARS